MMERRQDFCQNDPNNLLCQGINGFKSVVSPFLPGNGLGGGATSTSDSAALPTTPTLQGAASTTTQDTVSTSPVIAQAPPPSLSFITSLPTVSSSSFITSLPTTPASVSDGGLTSTESAITVTETATPSPVNGGQAVASQSTDGQASASPSADGQASGQKFPVALVAGVGSSVVALIIAGIALWYFFLRKRLRRRSVLGYSETSSVNEIARRGTQSTFHPGMTFAPSTSDTPGWQHKPPSIHTLTTVSPRPSFAETDNWPEPLSPRPVMQTTIQKMTVPNPVDASSFRIGGPSRQSSFGGSGRSSITPSSTYRQPVTRGPAPDVASPVPDLPVELPATPRVTLSKKSGKPGAGFQVVPKRRSLLNRFSFGKAEDRQEMQEQRGLERTQSNSSLQRQYTVRKSPLAQNPFVDPGDAEADAEADVQEEIRSPLKIVNPDLPQEDEDDEAQERQELDAQQEHVTGKSHEYESGGQQSHNEAESVAVGLAPGETSTEATVTPVDPSSPGPDSEHRQSLPPLTKRVSFAANS